MVTGEQLYSIMPNAKNRIAAFLDALNTAMAEFEINSPARAAAYLAQLAHESMELRYMEELASGEAYDHRADLGNTKPEAVSIAMRHGSTPGRWWKGHGPIQITGYDNHLACGTALGLDLLNDPLLITKPLDGCRGSGWFWRTHGLNELADKLDFDRITRRINGGTNGQDSRRLYFRRARAALGVL